MKRLIAKIWVPALLVLVAAVQSFGIDAARAISFRKLADSLILTRLDDTVAAAGIAIDSMSAGVPDSLVRDSLLTADSLHVADSLLPDSLALADSAAIDTLVLSPRDTIVVPDSLRETDPFKFKYYIAIRDSLTRIEVRDSLIQAGDTLELQKLDSLYIKDSTEVAVAKFNAWYASLSRKERKKYDAEQALPGLIAAATRKMEIKDSIRARKDSIIEATPRILETFALPDSMKYKRIVTWTIDPRFQNLDNLREQVWTLHTTTTSTTIRS
jgi:hypothetical protein